MNNELIRLIKEQDDKLNQLLELLNKQNTMIIKKDLYGLEELVETINNCSKEVAESELKRRNLMGEESLTEYVAKEKNKELEKAYYTIRETLDKLKERKETNELLLKQRMSLNARMLAILNPNRDIKTYNSYGGLRK